MGDDAAPKRSNIKPKRAPRERDTEAGETYKLEKWGMGIREVPGSRKPAKPSAPAPSNLPVGERRTLIAIAQTSSGVTRQQLSILTGYKKSTRDLYLQKLQARGLVERRDNRTHASSAGVAALGRDYEALPTGRALLVYWLARLPRGERSILDQLTCNGFPSIVRRDRLSELCAFKKSTRDLYLQKLCARRLVVTDGLSGVHAAAELFDGAPT